MSNWIMLIQTATVHAIILMKQKRRLKTSYLCLIFTL